MKKLSINNIKKQNLWLVFREIAGEIKVTRNDISARTGLSLMTVSNMLEPLMAEGIVSEEKWMEPSVGRKPSFLKLNADTRWMLVLDMVSRPFTYSVLNLALDEVDSGDYENIQDITYEENLIRFMEQLKNKVTGRDSSKLIGVGVSVAGPYWPSQDAVFCERTPELRNIGLMNLVKSFFDTGIFIDEDVKLATKAVMDTANANDMLYLYAGEGIGAGLVIGGQIYRGVTGFTGQVGQMVYNSGSFEDKASFSVFESRICSKIPSINRKDFKVKALELYRNQNPVLMEELDDISGFFAQSIYNIRCVIDMDTVIIDGDYNIFGSDFTALISGKLPEVSWHPSELPIKIIMCQSRIKNSVIGAGLQIRDRWVGTL